MSFNFSITWFDCLYRHQWNSLIPSYLLQVSPLGSDLPRYISSLYCTRHKILPVRPMILKLYDTPHPSLRRRRYEIRSIGSMYFDVWGKPIILNDPKYGGILTHTNVRERGDRLNVCKNIETHLYTRNLSLSGHKSGIEMVNDRHIETCSINWRD